MKEPTPPKSKSDLLITAHAAQIIDEQLSRQLSNTVAVDVSSFTQYIATAYSDTGFDLIRAKSSFREGLVWLMACGAVTTNQPYAGTDNTGSRKRLITVNLPVFKHAYQALCEAAEKILAEGGKIFSYDDEHGIVTAGAYKKKLLNPEKIEGYLMERVVRADGARISYADMSSDYDAKHPELDADTSLRSFTNAKDRVNNKLLQHLHINSTICYEAQNFWLSSSYCSSGKDTEQKAAAN